MVFLFQGCGTDPEETARPAAADEPAPPVVVATFSVLGDLVSQVAGDAADVRVLCPVGAEVHEWELTPSNFADLENAALVFANGLGLEQWAPQLEAALSPGVEVVYAAEASEYPTLPIRLGEYEGTPDPHVWMDPRGAFAYVEVIRDQLVALDEAGAETYRRNANRYLIELEGLYAEATETLGAVPGERRLLVTSEAAFLYFADAFGFVNEGIWGSNAEEEGTPQQVARIVEIIRAQDPAAIFWESTISDRYVQSVADETATPIAGPLYVDSLGEAGSGAEDYAGMIRSNAALIAEKLAVEN